MGFTFIKKVLRERNKSPCSLGILKGSEHATVLEGLFDRKFPPVKTLRGKERQSQRQQMFGEFQDRSNLKTIAGQVLNR
jgi:hypothetical protein